MIEPQNVRVVRLNPADVVRRSDDLNAFRALVLESEPNYPGIGSWLESKVFDGIRSSQRVAFVGYAGDAPAISAVVKRGRQSKFCHLRIADELQDENLGEMFFAMMAAEVRRFAAEVHFTLPESLWAHKSKFFHGFGFSSVELSAQQYRLGEDELRCSSPFENVWRATRSKLPKLSRLFRTAGYHLDIPLLLSVRPRFAEAIFLGRKRYEIRRRFSSGWAGARAAVLGTRPLHALMGEVTIRSVRKATPTAIWENFANTLACTEEELFAYCDGLREAFVLELDDVTPYLSPVPVPQLAHLLRTELYTPQSYCTLVEAGPWREAVSLAAMLHGGLTLADRRVKSRDVRRVVLPNETMPLFSTA